jgi:hypothetical protein
MPFFINIDGNTVQLCVFTARNQECLRKDCPYSHEPKSRRTCRFFHPKTDYGKDGEACLLGHYKSRDTFSHTKKKTKGNSPDQTQGNHQTGGDNSGHGANGAGGSGGGDHAGAGDGAMRAINPAQATLPHNPNPPNSAQNPAFFPPQASAQPIFLQPIGEGIPQNVPAVHFQQLAQKNVAAENGDEIRRLLRKQEEMRNEFKQFKQQNEAKEA